MTLEAVHDQYLLSYFHDDEMEVYVNGSPAFRDPGYTSTYVEQAVPALNSLLKAGDNLIAVHARNRSGPQFPDLGLTGLDKAATPGLRGKAKASRGPSLWVANDRIELRGTAWGPQDRLRIYSSDGRLRAELAGSAGAKSLLLPASIGSGMFRYDWRSAPASLRGALFRLP